MTPINQSLNERWSVPFSSISFENIERTEKNSFVKWQRIKRLFHLSFISIPSVIHSFTKVSGIDVIFLLRPKIKRSVSGAAGEEKIVHPVKNEVPSRMILKKSRYFSGPYERKYHLDKHERFSAEKFPIGASRISGFVPEGGWG